MQYLDVTSQHWNPDSARFAGGDHLMTALEDGWQVQSCRLVKNWYAGMRFVKIFEFDLINDERSEKMTMPVIHNPYIERFVDEEGIEVIEADDNRESV
jgi:hypothetical protein